VIQKKTTQWLLVPLFLVILLLSITPQIRQKTLLIIIKLKKMIDNDPVSVT